MLDKNILTYQFVYSREVLEVISAGNALVKTISSSINSRDERSWKELLRQIADPKNNRLVREVDETTIDRSRVYHPKLKKWINRDISVRGLPKDTIFTKKTPTTLLPPDGKITLFQPSDPNCHAKTGILFNLTRCHLKDGKYVFSKNQNTHKRWWLKRKGLRENEHQVATSISLTKLKNFLQSARNKNQISQQNEILACVSRDAVMGVFTTEDSLEERLNAIVKKALILEELKKDVPIFIISSDTNLSEYTLDEQYHDIKKALESNDDKYLSILKEIPKKIKDQIKYEFYTKRKYDVNPLVKLPLEMSSLIMDHLVQQDVGEITYFKHATKAYCEYSILNKLSYEKALNNLLLTINNCDLKIKIDHRKTDAKSKYESILKKNIFTIRQYIANRANIMNSQKQVINLISHLFNVDMKEMNNLLNDFLVLDNEAYKDIVIHLINKGAKPFKNYRNSYIGVKSDEWDSENKTYIDSSKWNVLVHRLLKDQHDDLVLAIINHLPDYVGLVLNSLLNFHQLMSNEKSTCTFYYSIKRIEELRIKFLLSLKKQHGYVATYEDKRLLEQYFNHEIVNLKSLRAAEEFFKKYKDCYILNQQRHPIYDEIRSLFFNRDRAPTIKKHILQALQYRSIEILSDRDSYQDSLNTGSVFGDVNEAGCLPNSLSY